MLATLVESLDLHNSEFTEAGMKTLVKPIQEAETVILKSINLRSCRLNDRDGPLTSLNRVIS